MGILSMRTTPEIDAWLAGEPNKSRAATEAISSWLSCKNEASIELGAMMTDDELQTVIGAAAGNHTFSPAHYARFMAADVIPSIDDARLRRKLDKLTIAHWIVLAKMGIAKKSEK